MHFPGNKYEVKLAFILVLLLVSALTSLYSQETRSNKVEFLLSNLPDTISPAIKILTPELQGELRYLTNIAVVNLTGEVIDNDAVKFLAINSVKIAINDAGLFSSTFELFPGNNEIRLVASDVRNNLQEQFIIIEYDPSAEGPINETEKL